MSFSVMRAITVKARVTEGLKRNLKNEMNNAIKELEAELQQLELQARRVTLAGQLSPQQQQALRQGVELERQKRLDQRNQLRERLKEVDELPVGSEIVQGTVQGPVQVEVGVQWGDLFGAEILLEDGKVTEIRKV